MDSDMTALLSCFVRAYCHSKRRSVFDDPFAGLLGRLAPLRLPGSALCFDYPSEDGGEESRKTARLASGAGTPMRATYSYRTLERLLADHGFLIYEHLDGRETTERFFAEDNVLNSTAPMSAPKGVCYCLAVKKPVNA